MSEIKGPVTIKISMINGRYYVYAGTTCICEAADESKANTIRDALNDVTKLRADLADAIKRIPPTGNDYFGNDNTAKMYMDKCADLYELESRHDEAVEKERKKWQGGLPEGCVNYFVDGQTHQFSFAVGAIIDSIRDAALEKDRKRCWREVDLFLQAGSPSRELSTLKSNILNGDEVPE